MSFYEKGFVLNTTFVMNPGVQRLGVITSGDRDADEKEMLAMKKKSFQRGKSSNKSMEATNDIIVQNPMSPSLSKVNLETTRRSPLCMPRLPLKVRRRKERRY
ncbi:6079_t:CDS:2 [Ambispora gerdemannii]|uniref:6079_t:CDS:1 n=1 Tax=Ambispora gerdemannii TaxID=144530 RepID=A0A9N9BSR1_9GLOM|nr:6079_t:CDS:2 [Ambispora gerdemannii]